MPAHALTPGELQREQLMLRELKKFHREHAYLSAPLVTTHGKKRVRVPHVDPDVNPFCMERQLADEYERYNFNRNPRFYINTLKNSPRVEENPHNHSSFINEAADLMASSGFSPRVRAEFTSVVPPVAYRPVDYVVPSVISVDVSDLRSLPKGHLLSPDKNFVQLTSTHAPPTHPHYSVQRTTQPVSFGHRPESASRMYDPLTRSLAKAKKPTTVRQLAPVDGSSKQHTRMGGMSAVQLQELLTPTKPKPKQQHHTSASPLGSPMTLLTTRSFESSPTRSTQKIIRHEEDVDRVKAMDELEKGYDNAMYYPPKQRKEIRFHPPTDHTTAQLIDKFRKLAVGKMP